MLCWNVNGLRSVHRNGFLDWLRQENPDMCCLQETRVAEEQLPPEIKNLEGYHTYFHCAKKPGYSGVGLFTKQKPLSVSYGMGLEEFDNEGRMIVAEYPHFVLIPTYFPSGSSGNGRLEYKMAFFKAYLEFIKTITHKPLIICGDVNVAHTALDLARPKQNVKMSGFLPEERAWVDSLLEHGMVDAFRLFNQNGENYTWWHQVSGARQRNVGWRLDYFFVSTALKEKVTASQILSSVTGSDHCPITLELEI